MENIDEKFLDHIGFEHILEESMNEDENMG